MKVTVDPLTGMPVITKNAPVVVSSSGGASGGVRSVRAGANVTVNNTDPANPIISATGGGGGGGGDMYTAVYDVTNDGVVDNSQALNGQAASYYLARANHTGTQAATTITGLATVATSGDYNDLSNKPTIPAAYTDEQAQDAVGNILTDTSTVDFTYNDAGNAISATVLDSPTVNGNSSTFLLSRTNHTGTQAESTITGLLSDLAATEKTANKNQINGYAGLDGSGKVAAAQLPSYVDDVVEVANFAALPGTGETGKIYVTLDTNKTYRWSGSVYVEVSPSDVNSVAGKTGVVTLVKGDVGLANVDNTSDANKPVSTAQASAIALKQNLVTLTTTGSSGAATFNQGTGALNIPNYAGGSTSPLTTKGDLYGFDSANQRIPIGSNNFVLTADSATTLGLKWAAIPTQTATGSAGGDLTGTYPNPTLNAVNTPGTFGSASQVPVYTVDAKGRTTSTTNTAIQITESQVTNLTSDLALKANDSAVVHTTGNETVAGTKTLSSPLKLSPQAATYAANTLVADSATDSLTYYNSDANVGLQIGQEEWIRVINNTGSTIANGAAVYLNGASGSLPTIALANSSAGATTVCAGLTTESIANGATGFVTCIGNVNGLDTSGFTAGQTVYLSATTAGGLTATAPVAPNYRYRVGIVGVSSASVGTIHVTPSTAALGNGTANQLFGINTAGTGQELKSLVAGSNVTITPGTNTITIAATSAGGTTVNYYSPVLAQEFTYSASNIFTLSQTPGSILSVTIQGQVLQSSEYGVAGTNVTVTPASHTFTSGDVVRVQYQATTAFSSTAGFTANIRTVTASTTVLATDRTLLVDTSAGAVTLTYPQTAGQEWKFKKITTDTNAMIIIGATGQTEFGANITTTSTARPSYTIQSNGTNGYAL